MRAIAVATPLMLGLAGCVSAPNEQAVPSSAPGAGATFLSIIGTPFLLAFKIPVCVASAVVAAPLAGASALAGEESARYTGQILANGLAQNCGPPYVLTPQSVTLQEGW
jgi:hypothetical protein